MNKLSNFGTALTVAAFVAAGVFTSSARLHAAGPGTGGGRSNEIICTGLKFVYEGAVAAGQDGSAVLEYAVNIGCDVTGW